MRRTKNAEALKLNLHVCLNEPIDFKSTCTGATMLLTCSTEFGVWAKAERMRIV